MMEIIKLTTRKSLVHHSMTYQCNLAGSPSQNRRAAGGGSRAAVAGSRAMSLTHS